MKRQTKQRDLVVTALTKARGFVSAQALHASMTHSGSTISLATVYRALTDMVGEGDVDSLLSLEGENLYRACSSNGHHHHLMCRECGATVEIDAKPIEEWSRAQAAAYDFTDVEHVVDIFGLCSQCA